jgi:hypothetical protein
VSIDEIHNRLELGMNHTTATMVSPSLDEDASGALGVPVAIVDASPPHEQTQICDSTGRSYCYNPMKAGTLVYTTVGAYTYKCTMGFHVQDRSNTARKAFAFAGHCPYGTRNAWYMEQYGYIGSTNSGSNLYHDFGIDFIVVAMNATQASRQIYDTSRAVAGSGNPITGESICISPGKTDEVTNGGVQCNGWVRTANLSWVSDEGFIIRGADWDGFSTRDGDSGSPIYRYLGAGATAIGIHNLADGGFARLQDALDQAFYSIN